MAISHDSERWLRRAVLGLIVLGLFGLSAELLLLEHYESAAQFVPFVTIAVALATVIWHARAGTAASVNVLQVVMTTMVVVGLVGIVLHYEANVASQLQVDPTLSRWPLFWKTMHSKVPPALAPAAMSQLGLLGLAYAWRHPATRSIREFSSGDER